MAAKYKKNLVPVSGREIAIYTSPKISAAFNAVIADMTLFKGVKFTQIIEAVYEQGRKDGARAAFEAVGDKVLEATALVPHENPGEPRKKRPPRT